MTATGAGPASAGLGTSRVIHAAMVASVLVYAVVAHIIDRGVGRPAGVPADLIGVLRGVLYGLGIVCLGAALVGRGRFLTAEALADLARRRGVAVALGQLQARLIVLMALAEAVAVYGLVLYLVGGHLTDLYVLGGASLLLLLMLAPRRELWEEVARSGSR